MEDIPLGSIAALFPDMRDTLLFDLDCPSTEMGKDTFRGRALQVKAYFGLLLVAEEGPILVEQMSEPGGLLCALIEMALEEYVPAPTKKRGGRRVS